MLYDHLVYLVAYPAKVLGNGHLGRQWRVSCAKVYGCD